MHNNSPKFQGESQLHSTLYRSLIVTLYILIFQIFLIFHWRGFLEFYPENVPTLGVWDWDASFMPNLSANASADPG